LARFPEFAGQKHLVNNRVNFVEIEDQVQLANVLEVFVQHLDKVVDGFEVEEVVVGHVDADAKVEAGVTPVNDLEVAKLHKVGMLRIANSDEGMDFLDQFLLLLGLEVVVPLGQPGLSGPVLDQDELDRHFLTGFRNGAQKMKLLEKKAELTRIHETKAQQPCNHQ